jgi:ankyrin repeat protein
MWASRKGDLESVKSLLSIGADVKTRDADLHTPLWLALHGGHVDVMEALLASGSDLEAKNACGMTPLMWAACNNRVREVQLLLSAGADCTSQDGNKTNALGLAAKNGNVDVVKSIETGIDGCKSIETGMPYLKRESFATEGEYGRYVMKTLKKDMKVLVLVGPKKGERGVYKGDDVNYQMCQLEVSGEEMYIWVEFHDIELIGDAKSNSTALSPLIHAAKGGHVEVIKALLDRGWDVNERDEVGVSPTMLISFQFGIPSFAFRQTMGSQRFMWHPWPEK